MIGTTLITYMMGRYRYRIPSRYSHHTTKDKFGEMETRMMKMVEEIMPDKVRVCKNMTKWVHIVTTHYTQRHTFRWLSGSFLWAVCWSNGLASWVLVLVLGPVLLVLCSCPWSWPWFVIQMGRAACKLKKQNRQEKL